jgi:prohibitin 1
LYSIVAVVVVVVVVVFCSFICPLFTPTAAQQEAERSKFMVLRAEQMKKAAVIQAEGEAEAARLISEATNTGPGFLELRKIEAAREISETLAKSPNVSYVPGEGGVLLNLGGARRT